MPWRYMRLRGRRVLARCEDTGLLRTQRGRVEIRYRRNDGRAYYAAACNLEETDDASVHADDYCAEAKAVPRRGKNEGEGKSATDGRGAPAPSTPAGSEVLVYADGACSGNPGPAGLGVVMIWNGTRQELSEYLGEATNNIAELTAIFRAARAVPDTTRPVRIYTDSNYAIGVLVRGWKAKANPELVADVREALSSLDDVELNHVPGHAGVELNERADELARRAIETRKSEGWKRR